MTEKLTLRDNAAVRWAALLLLALAMFCSYIFMDILSPIKDLMQSERGWDSLAFGTMQGSETFLNVFVFFLIFLFNKHLSGHKIVNHYNGRRTNLGNHIMDSHEVRSQPHAEFVDTKTYNTQQHEHNKFFYLIFIFVSLKNKGHA